MRRPRILALVVASSAVLAGCGGQSAQISPLKSLSPAAGARLSRLFQPSCTVPGSVLIVHNTPTVHGSGGYGWWCVPPAHALRVVSRDLRCPPDTGLVIDIPHHRAECLGRSGG